MHPIYILRHGETLWNIDRRLQGRLDAPLTDKGRAQAAAQGQVVADLLQTHPDLKIYCSPQGRARATWEIARGGFDGPVQYDPRLMEVDIGDWQGLTHDQIARRWPGTYQAHETSFELSLNAPEGERYPSLVNRVSAFVSALATPALVVTHGITSSVLRGLLLGLEFDEMAWLGPDQGVVFAIDSGMETILRPASVGPMA